MTARAARTVAAEACKLATLPSLALMVVLGPALSALLAAVVARATDEPTSAMAVIGRLVPLVQAAAVLLGHLVVAQERPRQLPTSLLGHGSRWCLVAGQLLVTVVLAVVWSTACVAAAWWAARAARPAAVTPDVPWGRLVGVTAAVVAMMLIAWGLGWLLRGSIASLALPLAVLFVVSPLLGGLRWARWLPDRVAARLHGADGPELTVAWAATVLGLWVVLVVALGCASLLWPRDLR